RFQHGAEQFETLLRHALATFRHDPARVAVQALLHRLAARRVLIGYTERVANAGEDGLAAVHLLNRCAARWRSHCVRKVRPCGAGKSRSRVQEDAKGSRLNRPRKTPKKPSVKAAAAVTTA